MTGLPPLSERAFQAQVVALARIYRWTVYHTTLSKWSERGYPDLTLVRERGRLGRLVFAELKRETGKTSPDQDRWLAMLSACPGVETYLWRPSDLDRISEVLR